MEEEAIWRTQVQHEAQRPEGVLLLGGLCLEIERRGEGLRGQVEDPPAAHHLQPHQQLLSPLSVREVHDHVSTRAGHPEPEGRVLHAVHAQDEQAPRQDMIFIFRKL